MRFRRFQNLKGKHNYHRTSSGCWMYKDTHGNWYQFHDDEHFANTVESDCAVRFFTIVPDMALPAGIL